jgi:5-methylcytosine-specific restriction endonuclease McrA
MTDRRASTVAALGRETVPVPPLGCIGAGWWDRRPPATKRDERALRRAIKKPIRDLGPLWPKRERAFELVELSVLIYLQDGRCWLCREPVDPEDASMDHVVALSMGGDHTYNNVRLAHAACNSAKDDMHPDEWFGVPPVFDVADPLGVDPLVVV